MVGPLKSWSYSTYNNFQKCPRRVYMEKVLKEPTPPLIIPKGKTEHPMERGSRIHEAAELYITEGLELISELEQFRGNFEAVRELKNRGGYDIIVEEEWAFTEDWNITGWRSEDCWLRMKLDLLIIWTQINEGLLVDTKTGRRHGNEISHMTQGQLYALAGFIRYPELEHLTVEFWYTDVGEITQIKYTRDFAMRFLPLFTNKGKNITDEMNFDAKPSAFACKYCPYGQINGNGLCQFAYGAK